MASRRKKTVPIVNALNPLNDTEALTPKERARELAYDAMESYDAKKALRFARAALKLDPDGLDALRIEANSGPTRLAFVIDALNHVVHRGEELLGPEFLSQNHGHFWLIFETRPYMRALPICPGRTKTPGAMAKQSKSSDACCRSIRMITRGCDIRWSSCCSQQNSWKKPAAFSRVIPRDRRS